MDHIAMFFVGALFTAIMFLLVVDDRVTYHAATIVAATEACTGSGGVEKIDIFTPNGAFRPSTQKFHAFCKNKNRIIGNAVID